MPTNEHVRIDEAGALVGRGATVIAQTRQNTERTTAGIMAALNSGAEVVRLIPGEYTGTSTITVPHTVRELIVPPGFRYVMTTDAAILSRAGTLSAQLTTITGAPVQGAETVDVASVTGLAVGDWILLTSETTIPGGATSKVGMMRKIVSIAGTTIGLDRPLHRSLTETPGVRKYTLAPPLRIHGGGRFEFASNLRTSGSSSYASFAYCDGPVLGNVSFGHGPKSGALFNDCAGPVVDGLTVERLEDPGSSGCAVTFMGATRDGRLERGFAENVRHGFTTLPGASTYGEPEDFYVGPGYAVRNSSASGLDTHHQGAGGVFVPNVSGCYIGVSTRSRGVTISGGLVAQSRFYGIYVLSTASETVLSSPVVRGVSALSSASGIVVQSPATITEPTVIGFGPNTSNYGIVASAPVILNGGVIDGGVRSTQRGIYFTSSGNRVRGTRIRRVNTGIREAADLVDNVWKEVEYDDVPAPENLSSTYRRSFSDAAVAYKTTATTVNNSTTVVADPELVVPVVAGAVYLVEAFAVYESSTVADFKVSWGGPGSSTFDWAPTGLTTTATSTAGSMQAIHRNIFGSAPVAGAGAGVTVGANFSGLLTAGFTGNFAFQFAQNSAEVSDTILHQGSFLRASRVG